MARLLAVLPLLAACQPPDPCAEVAAAGETTLELGLGDPEGFAGPTPDGEVVTPEWGSQGGRHVWLSLHTTAFWPGERQALGSDRDVPVFRAQLLDEASGGELTSQEWGWEAMDGDVFDATLALGELFLSEPVDDTGTGAPPATQAVRLVVTGADACDTPATAELAFAIAW